MPNSPPKFEPKIPVASVLFDQRHQVRESISEADQELLNSSVQQFGILVPLLMYALGDGEYRPIDGHRRFKAATAAGLESVPGYVFPEDVSELDCLSMALTTNSVRKNLTLLEKYQAVWQHHTEGGLTLTESARRCGLSQSAGTKLLAAVQNNPRDVILAFTKHRGSYRALYALTKCPTADDKRTLAKRFLSGDLNVGQLETEVDERFGSKKSAPLVKVVVKAAPTYEAILEELASIKKRILQLRRTDIDPKSIAAHLRVKQSEVGS